MRVGFRASAMVLGVVLALGAEPVRAAAPVFKPLQPLTPSDAPPPAAGLFDVTPTGEAVWSLPLWTPPGRGGIEPRLSVSYRSRGDNGILGQRFGVDGLPSITRCWRTIRSDGDFTPAAAGAIPDRFCWAGQRLVPRPNAPGELQPELDPSVAVRVIGTLAAPQAFSVYRSNGHIETYGRTSANAVLQAFPIVLTAPTDAAGRFTTDRFSESLAATPTAITWYLNRVDDRWGNYYEIDYESSIEVVPFGAVEVVPKEIRWTGFTPRTPGVATAAPSRRLRFVYATSPKRDGRTEYRAGIRIKRTKLLEKIEVYAQDGLVSDPATQAPGVTGHVKVERIFREYRFQYLAPAADERLTDRLQSVTECVFSAPGVAQCLAPITFSWSRAPAVPQFLPVVTLNDVVDLPADSRGEVPGFAAEIYDMAVGDFDGDARDDVVYRLPRIADGRFRDVNGVDPSTLADPMDPFASGPANTVGRGDWFIRRGTSTGLGNRSPLAGLPPTPGGDWKFSARVLDIDGNGAAELILNSEPLDPAAPAPTPKGYQVFRFGCPAPGACDFSPVPGLSEPTDFPLLAGFPRRSFALQSGDLNGDGRLDFVHEAASALQKGGDPTTLRFRAADPSADDTLLPAVTLRVPGATPPASGNIVTRLFDERFMVDLDGNGQADLVTLVDPAAPLGSSRPFTFSALSVSSTSTVGDTIILPTTLHAADIEASDVLGALIGRAPCYPPGEPTLHGMATDPQTGQVYQAYTRLTRYFVDVNGDGLRDSVAIPAQPRDRCPHVTWLPSMMFVSLNTGTGFRAPTATRLTVRTGFNPSIIDVNGVQRSIDAGTRVADLDADGRDDFLLISRSEFQYRAAGDASNRNQGVIWLRSTSAGFVAEELGVPVSWHTFTDAWGRLVTLGPRLAQVGDFNGDGLLDFVMPSGNRLTVHLQKPGVPDVVTGIAGGGLIPAREITYSWGSAATPGVYSMSASGCRWPQACLKTVGWLVASTAVETSDFAAPRSTRTVKAFRYESARTDLLGRGLLGVDKVIETLQDESTPAKVFATETREFDLAPLVCQNEPRRVCTYVNGGAPTRRFIEVAIDATRRALSEQNWKRTVDAVTGGSGYRLSRQVETSYAWEEATSAPATRISIRATRQTTEFDAYGTPVSSVIEASGNELPIDGSTPTGLVVYRTEQAMGDPQGVSEAAWLVSRYTGVTTASVDPTLPAAERRLEQKQRLTYEPTSVEVSSLTLEPARAGQETDTTSGLTLVTLFGRDERGSVTSVQQDGSGKTRLVQRRFDPNDRDRIFPAESIGPLGHSVSTWSHAALGVPVAVDGPNGIRTEIEYDTLGRRRLFRPPGGTAVSELYLRDGARNRRICQSSAATGTACDTLDPAGRRIRHQAAGFDMDVSTTFVHDRFGRLIRQSLPLQVSGARSDVFVELDRDGLGRVTAMRRPGETPQSAPYASRIEYAGLQTTSTSERGIVTRSYFDAKGRLVRRSTREPAGTPPPAMPRDVEVQYEYGHFDLPRRIAHPLLPASQAMVPAPAPLVTTMSYDLLGRLESVADPDSGSTTRRYDAFGQLKRVEDATGAVTKYLYDDAGRLRRATTAATAAYPSRTGGTNAQDTEYVYDAAPNGVGRLQLTRSVDGVETTYEYDTAGRIKAAVWSVSGNTYRFYYDYNAFGQVEYLSYPPLGPRPFRVKYAYAGDGSIRDVVDASDPAQLKVLWHQIARDAADNSTEEQFGLTAHVKRVFDSAYQLRFVWGEFIADGEMFQQHVYRWEGDGFLKSRTDLMPGLASRETYTHDFLSRLAKWNILQNCTTSEWTYAYDDLGNLRSRQVTAGPAYPSTTFAYTTAADSTQPHAVKTETTGVAAEAFDYGAAGQTLTGRGNTYAWSPLGLPWRIARTGETQSFLYDANGSRVLSQRTPLDAWAVTSIVTLEGLYEVQTFGDPPRSEAIYNVFGTDGIVAQVRRTANPDTESVHFIHPDHLGSPDAITSQTLNAQGTPMGAIVDRAKYEPFGERRFPWALAHPLRQRHPQRGSVGFTGHAPDDAIGLVNMRGRLYDPAGARFVSPDPLLGGVHSEGRNRYSYVSNSPLMAIDPSGFQAEPELPDWCTGPCFQDPETGQFGVDVSSRTPAQPKAQSADTPAQTSDESSSIFSGAYWSDVWQNYYQYTSKVDREQAEYDRSYEALHTRLRHIYGADRPRSPEDRPDLEFLVEQKADEIMGPRPENFLWKLVKIYAPGAFGGLLGRFFGAGSGAAEATIYTQESLALRRLLATRANLEGVAVERVATVLTRPQVFRHTLTGDPAFVSYARIEQEGLRLSTGVNAHFGEGVYAWHATSRGGQVYIDIEVPAGAAVENLVFQSGQSWVRIVPPGPGNLPVNIVGTNLPADLIELGRALVRANP